MRNFPFKHKCKRMLNKVHVIPKTSLHPFGITCKSEFFTTRPAYKCGQEIGMGKRHYDRGEVGLKQIAGQTTTSWLRHCYYHLNHPLFPFSSVSVFLFLSLLIFPAFSCHLSLLCPIFSIC